MKTVRAWRNGPNHNLHPGDLIVVNGACCEVVAADDHSITYTSPPRLWVRAWRCIRRNVRVRGFWSRVWDHRR